MVRHNKEFYEHMDVSPRLSTQPPVAPAVRTELQPCWPWGRSEQGVLCSEQSSLINFIIFFSQFKDEKLRQWVADAPGARPLGQAVK